MSELRIRHYDSADFERLKAIHSAQGIPYPLPNLDAKEFVIRAVIENGRGVDSALFLRKTAEAYLFMDFGGTPHDRMDRLKIFDKEIPPLAEKMAISEVYCAVPPKLERQFGRRLIQLGWTREPWPIFSRRIP